MDFVNQVLELTNQFRAQNGLAPLTLNAELNATAQNHSQAMAEQDFFSHTGLDVSRPWDRARDVGYEARTMGENIAAGQRTPESVVQGWINSPGHRANLLNPNFTELGVGYYEMENDTGRVNYGRYWTQLFGSGDLNPETTLSSAPKAAPPEPAAPEPAPLVPEPTAAPAAPAEPKLPAPKAAVEMELIKGSASRDRLQGTRLGEKLLGYGGNDVIRGRGGDDMIEGGGGRDRIFGGNGDDWLRGAHAAKAGAGERDEFRGGGGADLFVLGDESAAYYSEEGRKDFALIRDFSRRQGDQLQLHGDAGDYRLGQARGRGLRNATAILAGDDLVAVVNNAANFDLAQDATFVG